MFRTSRFSVRHFSLIVHTETGILSCKFVVLSDQVYTARDQRAAHVREQRLDSKGSLDTLVLKDSGVFANEMICVPILIMAAGVCAIGSYRHPTRPDPHACTRRLRPVEQVPCWNAHTQRCTEL